MEIKINKQFKWPLGKDDRPRTHHKGQPWGISMKTLSNICDAFKLTNVTVSYDAKSSHPGVSISFLTHQDKEVTAFCDHAKSKTGNLDLCIHHLYNNLKMQSVRYRVIVKELTV